VLHNSAEDGDLGLGDVYVGPKRPEVTLVAVNVTVFVLRRWRRSGRRRVCARYRGRGRD
jgi:hypothetical protein